MRKAYLALISTALLAAAATGHAEAPPAAAAVLAPATTEQRVDALLAAWDLPGMPGCAVAVIRDGKLIYRRGVGMADLEREAPIAPTTPFHVASMSKQFTAFAIYLLAQDGKLSLDDDIRKYLPELHDFGKTITIRHLLHHTSGLRDQWSLLLLAGWRLDDVITEDDIFGLLQRQQELNFAPGKEFLYSNTGFTLLGMIVKRVSGKPLPAFAQERIFGPLGMTHTMFHDDYGTLVKGRASSYEPLPAGGYRYVALSYSNVGATSLFTTVDDLALWDRNFYDGKVGGKDLLTQMQTRGELGNGKPIDYASGLVIGEYRGLKTVAHGGADAGYRSELLRFPDQHFSVAILANAGDFNTGKVTRMIADIYLEQQLKPLPLAAQQKPAPVEVAIDPAHLDALVGDYALSPQFVITFTKENDRLMTQATGQTKFPVFAADERTFFLKVVDAQFTFDAPGKDGVVAGGVLHQNGRDQPAKRIERPSMSEADMKAFEGEFYSDELHVLYTVARKAGKLTLSYPRGDMALDQLPGNAFGASFPIGRIQYQCRVGEGCSGFTVSNGRVRDLQFAKVKISATGARAGGN
jgi:CubicO group peptidase (beta-lactamase class C family)